MNITMYLLMYVDDLILTGSTLAFLNHSITQLATKFSIKDIGNLSYFLGIEVIQSTTGVLLSQYKYIQDLLEKTNMLHAKEGQTPMSSNQVPYLQDSTSLTDASTYRSIVAHRFI